MSEPSVKENLHSDKHTLLEQFPSRFSHLDNEGIQEPLYLVRVKNFGNPYMLVDKMKWHTKVNRSLKTMTMRVLNNFSSFS